MTTKRLKWTVLALAAFAAAALSAAPGKADAAETRQSVAGAKQLEARAKRMVKAAKALLEQNESERGVGMLEAVVKMYPDTASRYLAQLELGRHFTDKREWEKSLNCLRKAYGSPDEEVRAEALYLEGLLNVARNVPGEALMRLRTLTQEFPTSPFANDAYRTIGQLHFEAGRWTRAVEAYDMVGTAVAEVSTNEQVFIEASQRVFAHVSDKDLAVRQAMGEKTYVVFKSASGDSEKVELAPFGRGNGDFIGSVRTTVETTVPDDGRLTVRGGDSVEVEYVDANTESGEFNVKRASKGSVVSSGSVAFLDGAMRQRVKGVFVNQPAYLVVRDFDLDRTDAPDSAKVTVKTLYRERGEIPPGETVAPPPAPDAPWLTREEKTFTLAETGGRTGVFAGRLTAKLLPETTNEPPVAVAADEVGVRPDDKIAVEYVDELDLGGKRRTVRTADALVLVGGSTEPQSVVAHASEANIQAKKLVLEAQLYCKWGAIFKDVGLFQNAGAKADEGLKRIGDTFELARKNSLERETIESAYETRWNLLLVKDQLDAAIRTCHELVRRYPDTIVADRAFMQIAKARLEQNTIPSISSAISVLGAIVNLPESQLKAEAQYMIGEALDARAKKEMDGAPAGRRPDRSGAIAAYRACAETYPTSSFAGESYKKIVDYDIINRNYTAAIELLERIMQDYPDAPWLDEMLLKWGVVRSRLRDREGAKELFRRIVEEYPGGSAAKLASTYLKKLGGDGEE